MGSSEVRLETRRISSLHRLALVAAAAMTLLVTLTYVGLIVLLAYGVFWYATHTVLFFVEWALFGGFFAYVVPIIAGCLLVASLVAPLAARPAGAETPLVPLSLEREREPLLFAFVERIAELIGAPMPSRIDVDCQVNATVGLVSPFRRAVAGDFVLTIGLPLVAGLTTKQFGGVVAHELGLFVHRPDMRLIYVIGRINTRLARVVDDRQAPDGWPMRVMKWSFQRTFMIAATMNLVFFMWLPAAWLSHRLLSALRVATNRVSRVLGRQMTYDADRGQVSVAGTEAFLATFRRVQLLQAAQSLAPRDLNPSRPLPDDLPSFIARRSRQLPPEVVERIGPSLVARRTGAFDEHPADAERARAVPQTAPGVLGTEDPATMLFSDFAALAQVVTSRYYDALFGADVRAVADIDDVLPGFRERDADRQAMDAVFHMAATLHRRSLLPLSDLPPTSEADRSTLVEELRQARAAVERAIPEASEAYGAFHATFRDADLPTRALGFLEVGMWVDPRLYGGRGDTAESAREALAALDAKRELLEPELDRFDAALRARVTAALRLAQLPSIAKHIEDWPALQIDAPTLCPLVARLHEAAWRLNALRPPLAAIETLDMYTEANPHEKLNPTFEPSMASLRNRLDRAMTEVKSALATAPAPNGGTGQSFGDWLFGEPGEPTAGEVGGPGRSGDGPHVPAEVRASRAFRRVSDRCQSAYAQVARLVLAVEAVLPN